MRVYNCDISFQYSLHFFTYFCLHFLLSGRSSMSTAERTMNTEQRINLKFVVRVGKTPSQAHEMFQQVYGDNTMSRARDFKRHKRYQKAHGKWKMTPRAGGLQQVELRSTSCGESKLYVAIVAWLFKWLRVSYTLKKIFCRFCRKLEHAESLRKNGTKTTEWWSEGAPHSGMLGQH